jgi:glutamate synthase domain-containing protein 3
MTGGTVVILGRTGRNFGAGMTGGSAYVLDLHDYLERHYNTETVALERVAFHEQRELRELIEAHVHHTGSAHAASVLDRWEMLVGAFWRVTPRSVIEARVSRSA